MTRLRCRNGPWWKLATRLLLLCVAWKLGLCGVEARAQGSGFTEYDVKAALLAKFPQFIAWPGSRSSMTVGILGADPFGGALDKAFRVKRSRQVEDLKDCQIIFVSKSERGNVGAILSSLGGTNILTVGESDGFAKQGGVIGFVMDGDKVRFEINTGAAQRSGLTIKVQLSKLAVRVFGS